MKRQAVRLGFRALGPVHICQDVEVLERFVKFDYCLEDPAFLDYFESRTGLQLRWCDCCPGNRRLEGCWERKVESIAAEERWCRILRGQIQDVWEIYSAGRPVSAAPVERVAIVIDPGFGREAVPVQMSFF